MKPHSESAATASGLCGTPATYDGVICTLPRGHKGEHRYEDTTCTCDPEAYELGPEGQRRYFPDIACLTHGDPFRDGLITPDELARRRDEKAE